MVRYEKNMGIIHVSWGYDETLRGYFLTVTDERVGWREDQTEEVSKVTDKVFEGGSGHYLILNSYWNLPSRVSQETIFTFMRRYDIDPEKIGTADATKQKAKRCSREECQMSETTLKRCGRCRRALYCSTSCQTADWTTHKVDCSEP
ncbi:MAG: hypothetical protein J3R72DRAFT_78747 [Linnemannia gamsii]|nr:MAG: hypothetical protein J3R72DRAFT_78747 [Linnemannia gamsii]